MSYFLKSGNTFKVSTKEAMDLHERLPAGNYVIKQDMFKNLYLESIDAFEIKGKLYGDTVRNADRILNTFEDRPTSTGVMLTGEKGSGKSLLAKKISMEGAKKGIPTIVINAPWAGDQFNAFMQMIDQPCIVLFDEFEKVYDREDQEQILTLLDGVFPSKKLFVLTCNDKWRVDSHMRNRPGRIYYMLDFKGLEHDFIVEYCEDNLKAKEHIGKICTIASLFDQFNFDMLKAMIEEMNRYGETPQQVLKLLNAKPEFSDDSKYKVELQVNGVEIVSDLLESTEWYGNPLSKNVSIDYREYEDGPDEPAEPGEAVAERDWNWETVRFTNTDIKQVDPTTNKFVFMNDKGQRLVLTKVKEKTWHFDAF